MLRFAFVVVAFSSVVQAGPTTRTFCNPLNLDYGLRKVASADCGSRHGADPVIILFKNRYYLFSTWELPGYRVSDDLVNWKAIPFAAPEEIVGKDYTAAAAVVMDGWIYYTPFGKIDKRLANALLRLETMLLDFEKVIPLPHDLLEFERRRGRIIRTLLRQHRRRNAGHTG